MEEVAFKSAKPRKKPREDFTTLELKFIKQHTIDASPGVRLSPRRLAKLPEMKRHTIQSIATILKKYHWADPIRSRYIKSGKRIKKSTKIKLLEFLKGPGRFWPTPAVAKRFHCVNRQISRFRKKHNLRLYLSEEAMNDPVYRKWFKLREKKRINNLRTVFMQLPKLKLNKLEQKLNQFVKNIRGDLIWKNCSLCKQNWPCSPDFFQRRKQKSKRDGKICYQMLSWCLACPSNPKNKFR